MVVNIIIMYALSVLMLLIIYVIHFAWFHMDISFSLTGGVDSIMITSWNDMLNAFKENYDKAGLIPDTIRISDDSNYYDSMKDRLQYESMICIETIKDAIEHNAVFNANNASKFMQSIAYRMACYGFDTITADNSKWQQQMKAITLLQGRLYNSFSLMIIKKP